MAAENWRQKYLTNPITTNQTGDLLYFARSPYGITNDAVITWADFAAQFAPATGGGYLPLSGGTMSGNIAMGGHGITGMVDPTLAQDAATKAYADTKLSLAGGSMNGSLLLHADATLALEAVTYQQLQAVAMGLTVKPAVLVATTGNLVATYGNGTAGVGATLTFNSTGVNTIDGVALALNNNVLVKDQTTTFQNGWYTVTTAGAIGVAGILTRSTSYDQSSEIKPGDLFPVLSGTANANTSWLQYDTVATVGSDAIQFSAFTANPATFLKVANNLSDVASTSTSRTNLGVAIGSDVEAWSAVLDAVAAGTYTGSTSITTLGTIVTGTWHASVIGAIYGGTGQSSYATGDTLYASAANTLSKLSGNTTIVKQYLSQTGDGVNSAAPVWAAISGSDITGAALTKSDDTNVTLTLGGSPTTALLRAASLTLGWTGFLSLARGGTNANLTADNGAIVYSTGSAFALLAATATAGQIIQSGSNAAPTWSTATYPATAGTSGNIMTSDGTNFVSSSASGIGSPLTTKGDIYAYSTTNGRFPVAVGDGKILQVSSGATFGLAYSTPTYPSTSGSAGKVVISDGTNNVYSTPTFPNASASSGKFIRSDGTNWIASTPTLPTSAGTSGKILQSDGTNYVESTPTYPSASGTSRKIIVSDGTNNVYSTETWATPGSSGNVLTSDGTNWTSAAPSSGGTVSSGLINQLAWYAASGTTVSGLSTAANGVLVTSSGSVPSISTTLPGSLVIPSPKITTGIYDTNGNEIIGFTATASAVNYLNVTNNSTGLSPILSALGTDTDINIAFQTKGIGHYYLLGTATSQALLAFREQTTNGTNAIGLQAPASVASDVTFTLMGTDGTANQSIVTNGAGVLSFAGGNPVVQRVSTVTGSAATGTTSIPVDNTIPQNTEGDQYMSLAITPKASANILRIDVVWCGSNTGAGPQNFTAALFKDSTANALAAVNQVYGATTNNFQLNFSYIMSAGTTSATTFKVRAGGTGTTTFNGISGGQLFGGVMASSIIITEYTT